jgi:fucose 4-O-acetylase-like acetyltransferase
LLLLNGLAALMVPIHHAAAYGFSAMFLWTNRYRPVSVPNYDQLGSLPYYALLFIRQLTEFAIPSFLIVSGFYIAFINKRKLSNIEWNDIWMRIKRLLFPFFIWTVIVFILIQRFRPSIDDILSTYYYIPLISQYYVLSLLLAPLAKKNWKGLLIVTWFVQTGIHSLRFFLALGWEFPGLDFMMSFTPRWFFPNQIFHFSLGLVLGFHALQAAKWLSFNKWKLLMLGIFLIMISVPEYELTANLADQKWLGPAYSGFSRYLLAIVIALSILAFDKFQIPLSKQIKMIGSQSLGIYLVNTPTIFLVGAFMYHRTPWALKYQLIYQPVLIVFGLGMPILLMSTIKKSRLRRIYHYLFG